MPVIEDQIQICLRPSADLDEFERERDPDFCPKEVFCTEVAAVDFGARQS